MKGICYSITAILGSSAGYREKRSQSLDRRTQNRRQKVFNRGLFVCAGGLNIIKLTKAPLIYNVSRFNLAVLELCLGGISHRKPPVATGLDAHWA